MLCQSFIDRGKDDVCLRDLGVPTGHLRIETRRNISNLQFAFRAKPVGSYDDFFDWIIDFC